VYSGGIATSAKNPAGAAALIQFLSSPEAAPAISKSGLESLSATPAQ
jgi:molybdate transport system substrate-binding protein